MHDLHIFGRGGKRPEQNADNTLRSKARARVVELISEGPIVGIVGGAKGIYFDTTPIQNADDSFNYENVIWDERTGLPDQAHFTGSNAVETTYSVDTLVTNSGGPIQRTIVETKADAVNVIVRLNSLFKLGSNGVMQTFSVSYRIEVRPIGGVWTTVLTNDIINEKCTAPVQFKHRVDLPLGGSPWDIRVVRLSADDPDDNQHSSITFEGYVVLVEGKFIYPHSACAFIEVDAESVGSRLPTRYYRVKGRIIDVPTNYDPIARTYSGIWDGTFKQAWTTNPAWIFYDMVINDRYGIGDFIDAAKVDKWSLYTIGQHCDQLVPSGYDDDQGNPVMEPRYTYNGRIADRQEAYYALSAITSAWRGMGYWAIGQLFATADMPSDPVKLVTPANVINGHFSYSSTALKSRHSVVIVKWKDPNEFYQDSTELVIDEQALARYGWREKQVDLPGCTSRGLAHRYGKWILDVEQNETETVEYTASWDHADLRPGDLIAVADPRKAQVRAGGRIKSFSPTLVTLDAAFAPAVGETYELWLTMTDGSILKAPILGFSGADVTIAAQPLAADVNAMYVVAGTDVQPRQFRVLSISEAEENKFTVSALFHDPNKYARVEQGISFTPIRYKREINVAYPPTGLIGNEISYTASGLVKSRVALSWTAPLNSAAKQYLVSMHTPFENDVPVGSTARLSLDVLDLEPGDYTFLVRTVDRRGFISKPASLQMTIGATTTFTVPTVINLALAENPGSTVFDDPYVSIQWASAFPVSSAAGAGTTTASPLYSFNTVNVYREPTNELLRSVKVIGTSFVYDYITNRKDNIAKGYTTASRNLRFEVSVTDIAGQESAFTVLGVSNPVPATIAPTIAISGTDIHVTWPAFTETDIQGVRVWVSPTTGFDPLVTTPVFEGRGQKYTFTGTIDTDYYIRIAAFDTFGKTGLNISSEAHAKTTSLTQIFEDAGLSVPRLVNVLPATGAFLGETVLLLTDFKIYRWNGAAWTASVQANDIVGTLSATHFAQSLRPVEVISALPLPTTGNFDGRQVYVIATDKVYRYNGGAWSAAVDGAEIVAGSILTGSIAAGAIKTQQLDAGAVTASKLAVVDMSSLFSTAFSDQNELDNDWEVVMGSAEYALVAGGERGGTVLRVGNNSGSDGLWLAHRRLIPFDPKIMYYLSARMIKVSGAGTAFLGFMGLAADGVTKVHPTTGANVLEGHWHGAHNSALSASYAVYEGYTKGYGASVGTGGVGTKATPGLVHPLVKFIRPMIRVNSNPDTSSGITGIDWFDIDKMVGATIIAPNSVVTDHLMAGGVNADRLEAATITSGLLAVGAVKARNMEIDENLDIDAIDAGFQMGKSSPTDFDSDGLYMGRTQNADGSVGFGFMMGRTASTGAQRYIENTEDNGLVIVNSKFGILTDVSVAPEVTYTTNQTGISLAGKKAISLSIQAGGGGGKDGNGAAGTNGGDTVVQLLDGTTVIKTWTATGGAQGGSASGYGQNSLFGTGGAPGVYRERESGGKSGNITITSIDGGNATGYGAGGGAGAIWETAHMGGAKGDYISVSNYDISALANPKLNITIGAKGLGGAGAVSAPYTDGGDGSPGVVKLKTTTSAVVEAGVLPILPTSAGSFSKPSNATGATHFPNLGTGMWTIWEASGAPLCLNELKISSANDRLILTAEYSATFIADIRPDITVGNSTARTIKYNFRKMKV